MRGEKEKWNERKVLRVVLLAAEAFFHRVYTTMRERAVLDDLINISHEVLL